VRGLVPWDVDRRLQIFLEEDLGFDDITTQGLGDLSLKPVRARIIAKEKGIMSGGPFAIRLFNLIDPQTNEKILIEEGEEFKSGDCVMEIIGQTRAILMGERVALNLLQRLCGIATKTREFVEAVKGLPVKIADTRKTSPGLRIFEKYAVRCGGGVNHRLGLYDCALIKDNHISICGSVKDAIQRVRPAIPFTARIVVECENILQVSEAIEEKADVIMLDNMNIGQIKEAVKMINKRSIVEASGGVSLETVREIAKQGVDIISTGYITHHAIWLDLNLEVEEVKDVL
jgi:nicotinate-nucleotide pyrophosphorylase (carboxylating)